MLTNASRFGIEFAPEVVKADGNVRNLAWRVCSAKQVLVSSRSPLMLRPWTLMMTGKGTILIDIKRTKHTHGDEVMACKLDMRDRNSCTKDTLYTQSSP